MSWEEHFGDWLRNYITPLFTFLNLLGIYLIMVGIGLGALASALRRPNQSKNSTHRSSPS
jgi:hypothetical protein